MNMSDSFGSGASDASLDAASTSDRELLELAALAAGMETKWDQPRGAKYGVLRARIPGSGDAFPYWMPLDSDGDALRLAVKLRMLVDCDDDPDNSDRAAAVRRAIVRAAAAIGGQMKSADATRS
jgi:hypothetical protein